MAQASPDPDGLYLGLAGGRSDNRFDTGVYQGQLQGYAQNGGQTLTFTESTVRRRAGAWSATVGYMVTQRIGLEAGFLDLGRLSASSSGTVQPPTQTLTASTSVRASGPALALRLRMPLSAAIDLDLRLGDYYGKASLTNTYTLNGTTTPTPASGSGSSLLLGLGLGYNFAGHWSVRLDYLRVNQAGTSATGRFDVDAGLLGVAYTF